jgi:Tfp pilus assembly protein PilF
MARLDMAVEQGPAPEVARENFEKAVAAARSQYGRWIHRAEVYNKKSAAASRIDFIQWKCG